MPQIKSFLLSFRNYHSDKMEISNDGLEARKIDPERFLAWGVVCSERPVRGHVEFELGIVSYGWFGNLKLGVTLRKSQTSLWEVAPSHYTVGAANHCVWGGSYVYDYITTMKEMPYSRDLNYLRKGDRAGLLITSDGELHFLVNGEPQGRATYGIYRPGYDVYITVDHWDNCKATRITRASKPILLHRESCQNFIMCGKRCLTTILRLAIVK